MQEQESIWQQQLARYQFNAVVFYYLDATPWAQQFLFHRLKDRAWAPVFAQDGVIILLLRSEANRLLIARYELPPSVFGFSSR